MKYRVRSLQHSNGQWEAKYQEPEGKVLGKDFVQIDESYRLNKFFDRKEDADDYTVEILRDMGIKGENIEIIKE